MTAELMPMWVSVYGIAISIVSMGAVLMMGQITKRQRKLLAKQHDVLMSTVIGAANMWDTLTPEQIRTLHPFTVEVANRLPSWAEVQETLVIERIDE